MINDNELINYILKITAKTADLPHKKISFDMHFQKDLDIDSLEAVEILHKIEKKYKVKFINIELQEIQTVRDIFNASKKLLNNRHE